MLLALKILLSIISLLLLFLAGNWLLSPQKIMKQHDLQTSSATGLNYLRGDIGGVLLAGFIFLGMFLYQGGLQWLIPGVILLSCVIIGRLLSLLIDGQSKKGLQAIIVELIIIGLIFAIHNLS